MIDLVGILLARAWWQALAAVHRVYEGTPDSLSDLAGALVDGLESDPFDAEVGVHVGAGLVAAGLTDPAVLGTTAQILSAVGGTHHSGPELSDRLARLMVGFGQGYGMEMHRRRESGPQMTVRSASSSTPDERFRVVFDNAAIAIAIGDTDGVLLDANRGLAEMIGVPIEALRGVSVYDFAHPEDRDAIRGLVYGELVPNRRGTVKLEQRLMRADGSSGWASFAITFVSGVGRHADYLLAVGEDVTEQHRLREELYAQARLDPLTGLPNRRCLLERLTAMIARPHRGDARIGLCFVDIDGFKRVNDCYGHGTGDQVLVEVATRLDAAVRARGYPLVRIGGDEFIALIPPPAERADVVAAAAELKSALADDIALGDRVFRIAVSTGAVLAPVSGAEPDVLLAAADAAMRRAKASGKDRWVVEHVG
ncbi:PAS domain S-box-containing protein/diguanylate cyclase (GGDEF)-like protein [Nocardia neocaledoniensis]|uniref:PAS domain S-box-containing protein/diguanylate cyclase (GGDEF)-like protein n=1 Tax=Nocardia neocaledoniensis TaxID=236511 RepID=A0A317N5V3_9NOCA|nr:PAS domain S-box-containing protein/diguanylate cyclase (GGDEF)-like protein [Nocardia neocaledoniensis]